MNRFIHLVYSDPPAGVGDDEFNTWYDEHVQEILAVEGWESATRYRLDAVVGAGDTGGHRYLSLYELSCPPDEAVANLAAAGMGDASTYADAKDAALDDGDSAGDGGVLAADLPLPDWFAGVRFASWNATALGEPIKPRSRP